MKTTTSIRLGVLAAAFTLLGAVGTASAATPPPPIGSVDFPYDDFYAVPRLGTEEVVGTGCGGDNSVGDVIPDGIWRGHIASFDGASVFESTSLQFNLICVYVGATGDRLRAEWQAANPGQEQFGFPDGFMVDNNPRTRAVPLSLDFVMAGAIVTTLQRCAIPANPAHTGDLQSDMYLATDAWLVIQGGEAITAVTSCAAGGGEVIWGCFGGGLGAHAGWSAADRSERHPRCE
jgi:hypothetical protein